MVDVVADAEQQMWLPALWNIDLAVPVVRCIRSKTVAVLFGFCHVYVCFEKVIKMNIRHASVVLVGYSRELPISPLIWRMSH